MSATFGDLDHEIGTDSPRKRRPHDPWETRLFLTHLTETFREWENPRHADDRDLYHVTLLPVDTQISDAVFGTGVSSWPSWAEDGVFEMIVSPHLDLSLEGLAEQLSFASLLGLGESRPRVRGRAWLEDDSSVLTVVYELEAQAGVEATRRRMHFDRPLIDWAAVVQSLPADE